MELALNDREKTGAISALISTTRHQGTLHIRVGPMKADKTTWLNCTLTKMADTGFDVLKIVHSDDDRTDVASPHGSTHNSTFTGLSNKIDTVRASKLAGVDVERYHVIGIDESQFFPDLLVTVIDWVENRGKHVRVSGLDGDSSKNKFGQTLDLIPYCDKIEKSRASCQLCLLELKGSGFHGDLLSIKGPFTKRLDSSVEQKVVGGDDLYVPVCRYHHSLEPETVKAQIRSTASGK